MASTADSFFVPVVQWIATALGMSETLAGVTIVAIGNAGPDIAASFAAFSAMDPEQSALVFGSFLGGGMMVMLRDHSTLAMTTAKLIYLKI